MSRQWAVRKITVEPDASYFEGHFPDHPIVPGAVLLGWMLEAVRDAAAAPQAVAQLTGVKFLKEICPGDRLEIRCRPNGSGWDAVVSREELAVAKARIEFR